MAAVSLKVNGKSATADVESRTLLVQLLRENLRLTGTHVGCDTSQCGACVVLVNGNAVKSCTVLALQLEGADVLSIEGLAPADGPLHPMQEAFRENHGLQCGYCTPGMIMTAVGMVRRKGNNRQHAVKAAGILFCGLDRWRRCARGPFVGDDLLEAVDAIIGEGGYAIVTDAVDAQAAVFRKHVD